jgi:outer membrane biosynthesis protein TonB
VTPPVPLQPFIGEITNDAAVLPGDMEITVAPNGTVERIRLLEPSSYQDRWVIYAMKARQFRPAIAEGRAVRYRLRVRTTF